MDSVFAIAFVLAGLAWVGFMLAAMLAVLRLAPKGQKLRTYHQLSMWKFAEIRTGLGTAADPHLRTMRRGAYAFLIFFLAAAAVATIAAVMSSMNQATA